MKLKKLFCRCKIVEEMYPNNYGEFRIASCIKCGKKCIIDITNKNIYYVKNYKNIYVLEKKVK